MRGAMKKKLKDIANIRSGNLFRFRLKNESEGNLSVIQLRDLNEDGQIVYDSLLKIVDTSERYAFLKKGDIIFKAKSNKRVAVVIDKDVENLTVTMHYFIISVKTQEVIPEYVAWYLNQRLAQEYFKANALGTRIPIINKKVLEDISINFLDKRKQEKIIKIDKLRKREQHILEKIKEKRNVIIAESLIDSLK